MSLQRGREVLGRDAMAALPVQIQLDIVGMFACDCRAASGGRSDVLFQVIFARSISTTFLYAVFREVEALIGGGEALRRRCSCSDARVGYRMSVCSSWGCPCLTAGVSVNAGHKAYVGRSPAVVLAPAYECVCSDQLSLGWHAASGDVPHEANKLSRNRGCGNSGFLTGFREAPITTGQS